MALEAKPNLAATNRDNISAYGEIERDCIEAVVKANPYLQSLLPLFQLLYRRGAGELWNYDENANFVLSTRQRRGVRQGCVLLCIQDLMAQEFVVQELRCVRAIRIVSGIVPSYERYLTYAYAA
jgi:hypothetical protein